MYTNTTNMASETTPHCTALLTTPIQWFFSIAMLLLIVLAITLALTLVVFLCRIRRAMWRSYAAVARRAGIMGLLFGLLLTVHQFIGVLPRMAESAHSAGSYDLILISIGLYPLYFGLIICSVGLIESYLIEWIGRRWSTASQFKDS